MAQGIKIAVIGSNGFIGTNLCRKLEDSGHSVVRCDLPDVDITVPSTLGILEEVDIVYHLAVLPLNPCKSGPRSCVNTNIIGTINVLEAIKEFKIPRLIYASASSIYGDPDRVPVRENDPKDPLTIYGCCKLAAENIINVTMGNIYLNNNFKSSYGIFRFTNVYGKGQVNGVIPTIIHKLKHNETIEITGDGSQSRDFVYIDDVVDILTQAMLDPQYNFAMNLGSGTQTTINEVVALISHIMKTPPIVKYIMGSPDRSQFTADLSLLHQAYNCDSFVDFKTGIKKTILWSSKI